MWPPSELTFQLLWPLPHNVLSASPVQSHPQAPRLPIWWSSEACFTTPLISRSLPGGSFVREQKSTLILLSGKGIYWQEIRKLPQQKGMRNNQAYPTGPETCPGAGKSQAASVGHCVGVRQFHTLLTLRVPLYEIQVPRREALVGARGRVSFYPLLLRGAKTVQLLSLVFWPFLVPSV